MTNFYLFLIYIGLILIWSRLGQIARALESRK